SQSTPCSKADWAVRPAEVGNVMVPRRGGVWAAPGAALSTRATRVAAATSRRTGGPCGWSPEDGGRSSDAPARRSANGERRTANGERRTENGERRSENTVSDLRSLISDLCQCARG